MSVSNSLSVRFPIPVGCIIPYAGAGTVAVPFGYLICDGLEVLVADYPELYACIGDTYNIIQPDGIHFNLPDLVNRYIQGSATNTGTPIPTTITNASLNVTLTEPDLPPIPFTVTSATFSNGSFPPDNQTLTYNNEYQDSAGGGTPGLSHYSSTGNTVGCFVTSQAYAFNQTPVAINDPVVASDADPANITMTYLIRYTSAF
jgi:microcystin-dependent protein